MNATTYHNTLAAAKRALHRALCNPACTQGEINGLSALVSRLDMELAAARVASDHRAQIVKSESVARQMWEAGM